MPILILLVKVIVIGSTGYLTWLLVRKVWRFFTPYTIKPLDELGPPHDIIVDFFVGMFAQLLGVGCTLFIISIEAAVVYATVRV